MKKLIEKIKRNKKIFIGVVLGTIIFSSVGIVIAAVTSDIVIYSSPTGKTNVKDAFDELYVRASSYATKILDSTGITMKGSTYKSIIYLDPTNLSAECNLEIK